MKGSIKQRSPGSWTLRFDMGTDPDGKRKQKVVTVQGTKKQAEAELRRLLRELDTGTFVEPSKLTVSEYLQRWLRDYARTNVSPKTYETYEEFIRVHLTPALGHHRLINLQPLHVQAYYTQALETGRRDGRGGLSPQTVRHHHSVLSKALKQAIRWKLLVVSPCDAVEPPTVERQERPVYDVANLGKLLAAAEGTWLQLPILLAVTTGMRRGEILGLRWEDLDLDNELLAVKQQLGHTKETGLQFQAPKTKSSRRAVELNDTLVHELRREKARQAKLRLISGDLWQNHGLVICQDDGTPRAPDNLSHAFPKLLRRAGLPRIAFHDLRHSHASHLLAEGEDLGVVSARLGHARKSITLDIYAHVLPGAHRSAALRTEGLMKRILGVEDDAQCAAG